MILFSSAGKIQLWDTEKREEIVSTEVPNTTYFEWAPDGQHFLTCTTSPRMRVDNNFRVWHYGGEKVYEEFMTEQTPSGVKHVELAQVCKLCENYNYFTHFRLCSSQIQKPTLVSRSRLSVMRTRRKRVLGVVAAACMCRRLCGRVLSHES